MSTRLTNQETVAMIRALTETVAALREQIAEAEAAFASAVGPDAVALNNRLWGLRTQADLLASAVEKLSRRAVI
jgi:hypothetical protein